jgi:hypothetical protein
MSGVATAVAGSAVLGAISSNNAANKMAGSANSATALQAQEFAQQQANQAPYQQAGVTALTQMQDPSFQHKFSSSDFTASPGYQFSLKQGQDALKATQAATGNQVSGAGLAALGQYNIGAASQEYQQAFNNYQTDQNNRYGRLTTLAAGGAGANQAIGNAAMNYANQAGSNMIGAGNASAAGDVAIANSLGKGFGGFAGAMNTPSTNGAGTNSPNPYTASSLDGSNLAGGADAANFNYSNASNFAGIGSPQATT